MITTTDQQNILERLEKLENSYKRFKLIVFTTLTLAAASLLMGQAKAKPRIVDAEAFVLRDGAGDVRAKLEVKQDKPAFTLYDKKGMLRADLGLAPDGSPVMALYDEAGLGRVLLEKGFGDSWSLGFFSQKGKDVALFGFDFKGNPYIHFLDKDDHKVWSAP